MTTYIKIDRTTGAELDRQEIDDSQPSKTPQRALNKPVVWLPMVSQEAPDYDPETHKLVEKMSITKNISDLTKPVVKTTQCVFSWEPVELTADEIEARRRGKIAATDAGLARGVEDLVVAIIGKGFMKTADIPAPLLDKINARLALRGEPKL